MRRLECRTRSILDRSRVRWRALGFKKKTWTGYGICCAASWNWGTLNSTTGSTRKTSRNHARSSIRSWWRRSPRDLAWWRWNYRKSCYSRRRNSWRNSPWVPTTRLRATRTSILCRRLSTTLFLSSCCTRSSSPWGQAAKNNITRSTSWISSGSKTSTSTASSSSASTLPMRNYSNSTTSTSSRGKWRSYLKMGWAANSVPSSPRPTQISYK